MTQEYILRAMGENYSTGNLWDHLDKEAVLKAAEEIKALRAALGKKLEETADLVPQLGGAPDDLHNLIKITFAEIPIERINEICKQVIAMRKSGKED